MNLADLFDADLRNRDDEVTRAAATFVMPRDVPPISVRRFMDMDIYDPDGPRIRHDFGAINVGELPERWELL